MKAFLAGTAIVLLAACSGLNTYVGGGALTVKSAAELITQECGNTTPNGPCLPTSRISTAEKQDLKVRLQAAINLLEVANDTNLTAQERRTRLEQSQAILDAIEQILIARGVE